MAHPLDTEDVVFEVGQSFLEPDYSVTARHVPSGLVGEARGATYDEALAAAKDALLALLEQAGGC